MRTHSPSPTLPTNGSPARDSPITRSRIGWARLALRVSCSRQAMPSSALSVAEGWLTSAARSLARKRPAACATGTLWVSEGGSSAASMARASSTLTFIGKSG